jgi:8-oxo-dGTP pyrophosphatase MutT (NUDIX family)
VQVVYAQEPFPEQVTSSIMLCGPTPRSLSVPSWRPLALALLDRAGYQGTVFLPEPRGGTWSDYTAQIEWESEAMNRADCILFWIPRDLTQDENGYPRMGALTTNDEWGTWKTSGKVVLGTPPPTKGMHVAYQRFYAERYHVPLFNSLDLTVQEAVCRVTPGASRVAEECQIPLYVWVTPSFQSWYQALRNAGNRLSKARVVWTLQFGSDPPILWALDASVYVAAEGKVQNTEVIVGRPDVSTVVLWSRASSLRETEVVLVREFRAAVRTLDGNVRALPGGSSKEHGTPLQTAVDELREETGFSLPDTKRFLPLAQRQLCASIASFCGDTFSVEITPAEMAKVKAAQGSVHGVAADGERTYIEVATVGELLDKSLTDWATLGMIFGALAKAMR